MISFRSFMPWLCLEQITYDCDMGMVIGTTTFSIRIPYARLKIDYLGKQDTDGSEY
jgi:hypothetical protein